MKLLSHKKITLSASLIAFLSASDAFANTVQMEVSSGTIFTVEAGMLEIAATDILSVNDSVNNGVLYLKGDHAVGVGDALLAGAVQLHKGIIQFDDAGSLGKSGQLLQMHHNTALEVAGDLSDHLDMSSARKIAVQNGSISTVSQSAMDEAILAWKMWSLGNTARTDTSGTDQSATYSDTAHVSYLIYRYIYNYIKTLNEDPGNYESAKAVADGFTSGFSDNAFKTTFSSIFDSEYTAHQDWSKSFNIAYANAKGYGAAYGSYFPLLNSSRNSLYSALIFKTCFTSVTEDKIQDYKAAFPALATADKNDDAAYKTLMNSTLASTSFKNEAAVARNIAFTMNSATPNVDNSIAYGAMYATSEIKAVLYDDKVDTTYVSIDLYNHSNEKTLTLPVLEQSAHNEVCMNVKNTDASDVSTPIVLSGFNGTGFETMALYPYSAISADSASKLASEIKMGTQTKLVVTSSMTLPKITSDNTLAYG